MTTYSPRALRGPFSFLDDVLQTKRAEVAGLRKRFPLPRLARAITPSTRNFRAALRGAGPRFLFEHKRASPSEGDLMARRDFSTLAPAYRAFADGISVLTDRTYFNGDFRDLENVGKNSTQPILCKDFFLDEVQVCLARRAGADAILLILSAVDDATYTQLSGVARHLGMDVLAEVHTGADMNRAAALGATLIGINNRNLATLAVSLEVTERLAHLAPRGALVISESGIQNRRDVLRLAPFVDGFLIGSALLRSANCDHLARHFVFGDVKVCGLTRAADAKAAFEAGATFGGLIFVPGTSRAVAPEDAGAVQRGAPLNWVGVFRDAPLDQVAFWARRLHLSAVQLHGQENEAYRKTLRSALPVACAIWQTVRVEDRLDRAFFPFADLVLLDSKKRDAGGVPSIPFDWTLLDRLSGKGAIGLAGGITPGNVSRAVRTGVALIDVCSGVESRPGIKSARKLQALFSAIRRTPFKAAPRGAA